MVVVVVAAVVVVVVTQVVWRPLVVEYGNFASTRYWSTSGYQVKQLAALAMPEQEALPAETLRQLHALANLAGVPIDERIAGILCEMLNQHVTPSGVVKLLEMVDPARNTGR